MDFAEYVKLSWIDIFNMIDDDVDKYNYVTALRGYDCSQNYLKVIFSGIIRGRIIRAVGIGDFVELFMEIETKDIVTELMYEIDEEIKNGRIYALIHYINHVCKALEIIYRVTKCEIVAKVKHLADIILKYILTGHSYIGEIYNIVNAIKKEMNTCGI